MKKQLQLERLIVRARDEKHPIVNVADTIVSILQSDLKQASSVSYTPLAWVASLSSAAAACVLLTMYLVLRSPADAMSEVYEVISWVVQ